MTKTAAEVVESAMHLAGTYSLDFLTAQVLIAELNDAYRKVYDEIVESDNDYYICEYITEDNHFALPCNLYKIKTVSFLNNDGSWTPILRQPAKQYMPGYYYIENNCFHYNGTVMKPIQIRYAPQPEVITMPRESIRLSIPMRVDEWGIMDDEGADFRIDDSYYHIDFKSFTTEPTDCFRPYQPSINGTPVLIDYEAQTITDEEDNHYECMFESECHGKFTSVRFDCPYAMVSYEDGAIHLIQAGKHIEWNIEDRKGHGTRGSVAALHTDDTSLYGVIWHNARDNRYYYSSYVPDTVMSYPKNTLWKYMETSLAVILMSINGIENKYITERLLDESRRDFLNDLERDRDNVYRIGNLNQRRYYR